MTHLTTTTKANAGRSSAKALPSLKGSDHTMSTKTTAAKAQTETVKASRGFTVKRASSATLANAKSWMVAYLTGAAKGKYPSVAFNPAAKDRPQNFACMLAVGFGPGWTTDADGSAKVDLIQQAYGLQVAGRKLGFPAMSSASATVREKTMRGLAADWIGRADAKGTFHLTATKPTERVAVRALRGNGKHTGSAVKATTKAKAPKATTPTERRNGAVKVTVDKALRSAAKAAERNAQRAANRTKVAAERSAAKAQPSSAREAALADIAAELA